MVLWRLGFSRRGVLHASAGLAQSASADDRRQRKVGYNLPGGQSRPGRRGFGPLQRFVSLVGQTIDLLHNQIRHLRGKPTHTHSHTSFSLRVLHSSFFYLDVTKSPMMPQTTDRSIPGLWSTSTAFFS